MSGNQYSHITSKNSKIHAGDIINQINSSGPLLLLDPQSLASNENRQQLQQITEHLEDLKIYIQQHLASNGPTTDPITHSVAGSGDQQPVKSLADTLVKYPQSKSESQPPPEELEATLQALDGRPRHGETVSPSPRLLQSNTVTFNLYAELNLRRNVGGKYRKRGVEYELTHTFTADREDLIAVKALRVGYYVHKADLPPFSTTQFKKDDCHPLVRVANLQIGIARGWIFASYAGRTVGCSTHYYGFLFTRIRYDDLLGVTIDDLKARKFPLKRTFEVSIIPCPLTGCACRDKNGPT